MISLGCGVAELRGFVSGVVCFGAADWRPIVAAVLDLGCLSRSFFSCLAEMRGSGYKATLPLGRCVDPVRRPRVEDGVRGLVRKNSLIVEGTTRQGQGGQSTAASPKTVPHGVTWRLSWWRGFSDQIA